MDFNTIFVSGRLTSDPQVMTYGTQGDIRFSFSLACNYGAKENEVAFLNCVAFGKVSAILEKLRLQKGSSLALQGTLTISRYQDKNGVARYSPQIIIARVCLPTIMSNTAVGDLYNNAQQQAKQSQQQATSNYNNYDYTTPYNPYGNKPQQSQQQNNKNDNDPYSDFIVDSISDVDVPF